MSELYFRVLSSFPFNLEQFLGGRLRGMIGIIKAMGCYQQHRRDRAASHHPIPLICPFPKLLVRATFLIWLKDWLPQNLENWYTFQIRKIGRSPTPKPAIAEDRPTRFIESSGLRKMGGISLLPMLMIYLCKNRNFNTWTRGWLHDNTADKTYKYNKIFHEASKILNPKWLSYLLAIRKIQNSSITGDSVDLTVGSNRILEWHTILNVTRTIKRSPQKHFAVESNEWLEQYLLSTINHQST